MKSAQPELLVQLDTKITRILTHWEGINEVLPAEYPLVLRQNSTREAFAGLAEQISALKRTLEERKVDLVLARGNYEVRKTEMHRLVRMFKYWMLGSYQWTSWFVAVPRIPGRGQSYGHWSSAAQNALTVWEQIVKSPPGPDRNRWPLTFGDGTTIEQFAEALRRFDEAYWEIIAAEADVQIARGNLRLAQNEVTALLMAYGHGVLARFGADSPQMKSLPRLWPKEPRKRKARLAVAA